MERFCGQEAKKKKIISDNYYFRVTFKSNHIYDGYGFQAYYQFKSYGELSVGMYIAIYGTLCRVLIRPKSQCIRTQE